MPAESRSRGRRRAVGCRRLCMTSQRCSYGMSEATVEAAFMTIPMNAIAFVALMACAGCAVPKYDVSYTSNGLPTVSSTIAHIKCELTDLVRDPLQEGSGSVKNAFEQDLLNGDYDVQITLELEVNDTGALTPSVTFMEPITKLISFSLGGSATLSESRDHHFTNNYQLSMRQLYADAQKVPSQAAGACPTGDGNLGRTLGIHDFVAMGFQTDRLPRPGGGSIAAATEAFGGVITFLVTKNVSGVGPTWTTTRWKGPGGLVGLSEVNTDKLTLAFAQGPNAGQKMPPIGSIVPNGPNLGAYSFTQQQLNQSISTQLQTLQTQLSP
jgi:hypothetical protein